MKQVSRNIDPASAHDLLARPARACIGFSRDGAPVAQPVTVFWRDARYFIGIPSGQPAPNPGQEIVLLSDEGIYWFDLRALYIRGAIQPTEPPDAAPAGHSWIELTPAKTVAWDYGTLHEVNDGNE